MICPFVWEPDTEMFPALVESWLVHLLEYSLPFIVEPVQWNAGRWVVVLWRWA